jgi:zinc-ribbon domain
MAQASIRVPEYWRPANPDVARLLEPRPVEASCWNCGIEYSPGAQFCHVCGSRREPGSHPSALPHQPAGYTPKHASLPVVSHLHLTWSALICFLLGVGCTIGAGLMGAIYRTETLLDWQAVQIWRIEWLLAALAALLGGVLLQKAG